MLRRILIVSASAGAGHVRAAQALEKAFAVRHPTIETRHVDILDFTHRAFRKAYARGYLLLANRLPALWGYAYAQFDRRKVDAKKAKVISVFDRIEYRAFRREVEAFAPDAILGTHFLPAAILDPERGGDGFGVPLSLVVTDFDVHSQWIHRTVSRYFVGSDEVAFRLAARGIAADRIEVTGIPIDPVFAEHADRDRIRTRLGLRDGVFTALVMSGGLGMKGIAATVAEVLKLPPPLEVLAVCGRNREAEAAVRALAPADGVRLHAFGFVDAIQDLMVAADVAVTKSGGLSVSECLALRLPMIVWSPIPGQEERNADTLLEAGAALKAVDLDSLRYKIAKLRAEPAHLARIRNAAAAIARPDAAFAIADSVAAR
ncbi:MAG: galactosyldiacylglycerol synthase [Planctomycetes bacterium]|nr:galactosyldiacylglycerol synthase [Planctomycetota bacterium]MBI3846244.1 galactosyldiacylglycerol synthase [Planctomycetota bacterium]